MSILTKNNFKGVKLDKLNQYIRLINESLNVKIFESPSWQGSVSNLKNFLNENNFAQHEGLRINDKSISNFISRLTRKITLKTFNENNFLTSNKTMSRKRPVIPELITNVKELNKMREKSYSGLSEEGYKRKDLSEAINEMAMYRQKMAEIRPKKKEKKSKYGNKGMDELVKIVTKLNQDIKQIRDTQSVVSANDWINRHGLKDLYEAKGRDLDGDGIPEVVVQTRDALQKPVIVNGYTTVPSLFPYRNAFYKAYPSYEERKEAHKKGINLRLSLIHIFHYFYELFIYATLTEFLKNLLAYIKSLKRRLERIEKGQSPSGKRGRKPKRPSDAPNLISIEQTNQQQSPLKKTLLTPITSLTIQGHDFPNQAPQDIQVQQSPQIIQIQQQPQQHDAIPLPSIDETTFPSSTKDPLLPTPISIPGSSGLGLINQTPLFSPNLPSPATPYRYMFSTTWSPSTNPTWGLSLSPSPFHMHGNESIDKNDLVNIPGPKLD